MPVVCPGAFGYGASTRGAFSGGTAPTRYFVNTLADTGLGSLNGDGTGQGSLRWGIETLTGPRVIMFTIGGYFPMNSILNVRSPFITIAGETAPGGGVEIQRYGMFVTTNDVVMTHIAVRPGEWGQGQEDNCCIILFETTAFNHFYGWVSATFGPDETFAADKYGAAAANISFHRCIAAESLRFGASVPTSGGHAALVQSPTKLVNFSQCIIANSAERNYYAQSGTSTAGTNNLVYNGYSIIAGTEFEFFDINGNPGSLPIYASIAGNHYIAGPQSGSDPTYSNTVTFLYLGSSAGVVGGSQIYLNDNISTTYPGTSVIFTVNNWGYNPFVGSPPSQAPLTGFTIWPSSLTKTWTQRRAGKTPANRPTIDQRIINYINTQGGPGYINSQNVVGGYPAITPVTRPLTPPANFASTNPVTGYTFGEEWLQDYQWAAQGVTINVAASDNLQTILNMAEAGDTIVLQAGATFTGNFVLPVHPGNQYITIMSAGTLPADGARVTPGTATNFAKIQASAGGLAALRTAAGAAYWRVIGVEFPNNPGGFNNIIDLGDGSNAQSSLSQVPHHLILDRCYIHGHPTTGQKRGVGLNSGDTQIINCYISACFLAGQDTQAIAGWNGTGPWKIDNCYIEGASENLLIGGDSIKLPSPTLPSDITITNNSFAKIPAWRGVGYNIKNLLELKTGVRVVIDNNTFDYNWGGEGQTGYAIVFTVRNELGTNNWATISDVQFTRNVVRHSASVFNILGLDDRPGITSVLMQNLLIQDTLCYDISTTWGGAGHFAQVQRGANITFNHNTGITTQPGQAVTLYLLGNNALSNFVFTNNIIPNNSPDGPATICIAGDQGTSSGIPALQAAAPGYTCARNVIYGPTPFNYPPDAFYPATINNVGFHDVANNDYRLNQGSPYVGAGLDGTDIGARFATNPPPLPGNPPAVPSGPSPANGATGVSIATTVSWAASSGATSYSVAFGTTAQPPVVVNSQTALSYDPPGNLLNNTTYFWQIIASNADGSTLGPVWSFTTTGIAPPGAPSNPSPVNTANNQPVTTVVSWSAATGATAYDVYFGTTNPPPLVSSNQTATSYDPPGNLANGESYFWQVVAKNSGGSTAGPIWAFSIVVAPQPPGVATNPSPSNGATNQSRTPTLTWTAGSGTTTHTVAFGTVNPPPTVAAGLTSASYAPGTLAFGTQYFWRITEVNNDGVTVGPVWSFTTLAAPSPPGTPSTPNPADLATGVLITTNVSWAATSGATSYTVAFGTVNPPPTVSTGQTALSYDPPGNLAFSTTYFWRVTAVNGGGSTAGPVWRFTTEAEPPIPVPPQPPTTPSPVTGATGVSLTPTLTWGGASGATTYTVRFGTTATPPIVAGGVLVQSYTPGTLLNGTTYFWQIIANNADGSTAGPVWSFTTIQAPNPPSAPTTPSPTNGATSVPITSGVSWAAASGAVTYTVRFGTSSSPPVVSTGQAGTSYTPLASLSYNTTYFWQVTAVNAGGSTSGPVWSFTTRLAPPGVPASPTPANLSTGRPITQTLSWGASANATSYLVAFGVTPIPPVVGTVSTPAYNPGTLQNSTTYYWQITAQNIDGSTPGPIWSFTTVAASPPPATPSSPAPANAAVNVPITTVLSWAISNGATTYHVDFGTTNPPPRVSTGQTPVTYDPKPRSGPRRNRVLAYGTVYYWRVTANNAAGSTAGPVWSFRTEDAPAPPQLPGAPNNPSPVSGQTGVAQTVVLSWSPAAFATTYRVAFGTASPPPTVVASQAGVSYDPPGDLVYGRTYFWQVTSINSVGSTAGPIWTFTVLPEPTPDPPSTPSPVDGATGIDITTALAWAAANGASSYTVKFGTSPTPPTVSTGQTGTSYNPVTALAYNTTYYWQILAVNSGGSTPGPVWSFTTRLAPSPPTAPSTPSPANTATGVAITPTLTWGGGSGATGFTVAFGTVNPPPVVTSTLTASYTPGTLLYSTTYFWRVVAVNADGTTAGPVWSFTTAAAPAPPGTPSTPSPADLATGVDITTNVSWAATSGALTYDVAFGTVNPPPTVSTDQISTSYDPPGALAFSTTYFWKVTANNTGGSTAGPVWRFTTAAEPPTPVPPDPPDTPSPTDGATNQATNTTLAWSGAAGATTYTVKFGTSSPPSTVAGGVLVQAYDPGALTVGTTYYWQVIANNPDGSTAGPIWSFSTLNPPTPPSAPVNPSPVNGAIDVEITAQLGWDAVTDADTYSIAFGTSNPPPLVAAGQAGITYNPGVLDYSQQYFWQITAINEGGATASAIWSFTTQAEPPPLAPDPPITPSPADGATGVSITPTLSWADSARAESYAIAFGTVNPPPDAAGGLLTASYTPGTLAYSTTYYWKVTANNAGGSTAGAVWSFTTIASPPAPTAASNPNPADTATGVAATASLSWTVGANTDTMDVAFGTVNPPPTVATGQTANTYDPPGNLTAATTYYWRITSSNAFGTTVGSVWSFTTAAAPPPDPPTTPTSPSPANGATDVDEAALLTWSSDNAVNYDLYFGTYSAPPLFVAGLTSASYDPPLVVYGQTYYWQIVANNASGSTAGPIWSFTLEEGPAGTCDILTSDLFRIVTSDGFVIQVHCETEQTTARVTQLPLVAAYDYAILQPFLDERGQRWATPWKRCP